MPYLYPDEEIDSVGSLLAALKKRHDKSQPTWFRGHSDVTWTLVPSVARDSKTLETEIMLIKRFKQNALRFLPRRPESDWEWMFLMQHYGAKTRLLDWSESALIGLYFAINEPEHHDKDGAIWCLHPRGLNENAGHRFPHSMELPFLGVDQKLEEYLPEKIAQERSSIYKPMAAMAIRDSARIYAQLGVFTIIHREPHAIESIGDLSHIWRFIVPKEKKAELLEDLYHLSINRLTIFPELASVGAVSGENL